MTADQFALRVRLYLEACGARLLEVGGDGWLVHSGNLETALSRDDVRFARVNYHPDHITDARLALAGALSLDVKTALTYDELTPHEMRAWV
jgi:hypothetical protein